MKKSNKTIFAAALLAFSSIASNVKADEGSSCTGFRTYTIGGWGANCNGSNPGCYRDANFAQAFPNGLTIGAGSRTLTLTSAQTVNNFLPSGGTASILPLGNTLNPGGTYNNVLAAQLIAVTLAVGFDNNDPNFASSNMSFGNLKIKNGPFVGLTVVQFLALANNVIGGNVTSTISLSDFNNAATKINESFDNGVANYSETSEEEEEENGEDAEDDEYGQYLSCKTVAPLMASIVDPPTIDCYGNYAAQLTVTATGGVQPYSYLWSTGATSTTITNLPAGTYSVTVTDANGNTTGNSLATIELTQPLPITLVADAGMIACNGGTTEINVTAEGGVGSFTGLGSFSNITAGAYTYTVVDANGCSASTALEVTEPAPLVATANATAILCNGGTSEVVVSANGGTQFYDGVGSFTVTAGEYTYSVTDVYGCSTTASVSISEPTALVASSVASTILCNGGTSEIVVFASGGTAEYIGTGSFTVNAGNYDYTLTDANGCTATTSISVSEPTALTASSVASAILCNGGSSTVIVSANGGTAEYTGTDSFTVSAGEYTYNVTDANGCATSTIVTVSEPSKLTLSATATDVNCNGAQNGKVSFVGNGGTTPYTYSTSSNFTNLAPGSYSATVTDVNGCSASASASVTQPMPLAISVTKSNANCFGGKGNATATVTGGNPDYFYSWDAGTASNLNTANLLVGNHNVVVTDSKGCTIAGSANIQLNTCTGFTTVTQGGWGASCSGGNWGTYLSNKFATAFPTGLTIGANHRLLKLTSASAVKAFLPSSGNPNAMPTGTMTNPTCYKNTLAGQAVALTINLGFDAKYSTFSVSTSLLSGLVLVSGPCSGMTVAQALAEANKILGGVSSNYSASTMTSVLDVINKNYDNGTCNLGALACACPSTARLADAIELEEENTTVSTFEDFSTYVKSYPNPFTSNTTVEFNLGYETSAIVEVYSMNGQKVAELFNSKVDANQNFKVNFNANNLESGIYFVKLSTEKSVYNHKVVLTK